MWDNFIIYTDGKSHISGVSSLLCSAAVKTQLYNGIEEYG